MPSLHSLLVSTALVSFVAASPSFQPRATTCPAGSTKYVCNLGNGKFEEGCCEGDACMLDPCPKSGGSSGGEVSNPKTETVTVTTTATTTAVETVCKTTHTHESTPTPSVYPDCKPGVNYTHFEPRMYSVFPNNTEATYKNLTSTFIVSQEEGASNKRDAILIFDNVNAAKDSKCELNWDQPLQGSNFGYFNHGLMHFFKLDFPDDKKFDDVFEDLDDFSYGDIEEYIGGNAGQPDITFWPQSSSAMGHIVSTIDCKKELAYYVTMSGEEEGIAIMETSPFDPNQVGPLGWNLRYKC